MAEHRLPIPFRDAGRALGGEPAFAGVLYQHDGEPGTPCKEKSETHGRPLAVFIHGMASHKNALFFKTLAHQLGIDTYRYDQRGEGDTPGLRTYGQYDVRRVTDQSYADELYEVIEYLRTRFGYVVELLVCHSRGCAIAYTYVSRYCTIPTGHPPPAQMAMFSGRYHMQGARGTPRFSPDYTRFTESDFDEQGYATLALPGRNGPGAMRIARGDFEDGCSFPTGDHVDRIPAHIRVLIAHGTEDAVVPMTDAPYFVNALTAQRDRRPGSVRLELVKGGDHNYSGGVRAEIVARTLQWRAACASRTPPAAPAPGWAKRLAPGARRGALIVVEGLDRAGKSTQVDRLVASLDARLAKFPDRTTEIGAMINAYLTNECDTSDEGIHLLFSANRWEVIPSLLDTLASGKSVVCDRYAFSGIAYSRAKGLDLAWCLGPDDGLPLPDLTVFLDLDAATAAQRGAYGEERYETQTFQRAVRHTFMDVERLVRDAGGAWQRIDAAATPDQVYTQLDAPVQQAVQRVRDARGPLGVLRFDVSSAPADAAQHPGW